MPSLNVRTRILLLLGAVTIGLVVATELLLNVLVSRYAERGIRQDLDRTLSTAEQFQAARAQEMAGHNRLISDIPFLKALVSTKDPVTLQQFASDLREKTGMDLVVIADEKGQTLVRTDGKTEDLSNLTLVRSALSGRQSAGGWIEGDIVYHAASVPVALGPTILGVLVLGSRINDELMSELRRLTNSQLSILSEGHVIASTLRGSARERLLKTVEPYWASKAEKDFYVDLDNERYASRLVSFKVGEEVLPVRFLIQRSWSEETSFLRVIRWTVLGAGLAIMAVALWISLLISRHISDPIRSLVAGSKQLAGGDLSQTVKIDRRDELGVLAGAFNEMVRSLRGLLTQVAEAASAVGRAAKQIDQAAGTIVQGVRREGEAVDSTSASIAQMGSSIKEITVNVETLATLSHDSSSSILEMGASIIQTASNMDSLSASVESTASSVEEMTASIKEVASSLTVLDTVTRESMEETERMAGSVKRIEQNVGQSSELSDQVMQDAEKGKKAVQETIHGMEVIRRSTADVQKIVLNLSKSSEEIGKILTVIDEVTRQTNLLSLNAAILAAQAGEYGKGFAVVASEIKNLADRTASSTMEIGGLIGTVQSEISGAVEGIQGGMEQVDRGVVLSREAGEALEKIFTSARLSLEKVREILVLTQEQTQGSQRVGQAMQKIRTMVSQIAVATQEQRKGTDEIVKAVVNMREMAGQVQKATKEQSVGSRQITSAVQRVTTMVELILKATQEQRKGSDQILQAVEVFRGITDQTMKATGEMNTIVGTLNTAADGLVKEVGRFRL